MDCGTKSFASSSIFLGLDEIEDAFDLNIRFSSLGHESARPAF
jgi:hypothetical protein